MTNIKRVRNSSVELLRIIAMLFIVTSHYCVHSGIDRSELTFGFNKVMLGWGTVGNLGVIIFVMITGYFMCRSTLKLKSVFRVAFATWFYSIVFFVLAMLLGGESFSLKAVLRAFLPITASQYWFVSSYLALMLFVPFINKLISVLTRRQFLALNCIMVIMWSVFPTFVNREFYSNELTSFLMYYMLGAYMSLYPDLFFVKKSVCAVFAVASLVVAMLWSAAVQFDGVAVPSFLRELNWYSRNSLFMIFPALMLLALFSKLKINSRFINILGSCTFGVYLIHENRYVRSFLWQNLFNAEEFKDSPLLILHMAVCVAAVFVLCSAVEYLRKLLIEKNILKLYSRLSEHLLNSRLFRKINEYTDKLN